MSDFSSSEIPNSSDCISRQASIDADALRAEFPMPKDMLDPNQALVHITGIWAEIDSAPTIEERKNCETCRYNSLEWDEEPCDSCTGDHWKPERKTEWIPIKWHDCTDADREKYGFSDDIVAVFDCEMPDDDQAILVTTSHGYVNQDVCYIDDGFSLDSGYDWIDDITAWMPLPKPYEGGNDA